MDYADILLGSHTFSTCSLPRSRSFVFIAGLDLWRVRDFDILIKGEESVCFIIDVQSTAEECPGLSCEGAPGTFPFWLLLYWSNIPN